MRLSWTAGAKQLRSELKARTAVTAGTAFPGAGASLGKSRGHGVLGDTGKHIPERGQLFLSLQGPGEPLEEVTALCLLE